MDCEIGAPVEAFSMIPLDSELAQDLVICSVTHSHVLIYHRDDRRNKGTSTRCCRNVYADPVGKMFCVPSLFCDFCFGQSFGKRFGHWNSQRRLVVENEWWSLELLELWQLGVA